MTLLPRLSVLYLYVTNRCNLSCAHCWIDSGCQKNEFIEVEQLKNVLDTMLKLGLRQVNITGGEPLLHEKLLEIVKMFYENNVVMYLNTNGTLLTKEKSCELGKFKNYLYCSVSVDGALEETHDAIRGCKGAYNKAVTGIKELLNNQIPCEVIYTIQKRNLHELEEVIMLANQIGINILRINFLQYGTGDRINDLKKEEGNLSIFEILELNDRIQELAKRSRIRITTNLPYSFYAPQEIINLQNRTCGIKHAIGILPDGSVSLCGVGELKQDLVMGNIKTDSLEKIWENNKVIRYIRDNLPERLEGVCGKCCLKTVCCGYCIAQNYMDTSSLNASYNLCEELYAKGMFPVKYLEK